ncbi:histidine phosphatase family protein [Chitinasiproducens palmae]|uniref:Broad specificity phosphatase PhoE n=1 Tax=Chitinasiproducens palmae TaxID=1770053 RepID=A0A1H2PRZ6_9BURK|nr:histidine phosphatase family protein [Chitinasiproducens palmae]SDV49713.1 Broad specificity phosphatase PhoE [Chitinasiproducens palmae]
MVLRLTMLCQPATAATRRAAFADDEPPEADLDDALRDALRTRVGRRDAVQSSPAACALGCAIRLDGAHDGVAHGVEVVPALCDWDAGRWRGRSLADLQASEPDALAAWRTDPDAAPHGGESLRALLARVGDWLDAQAEAARAAPSAGPQRSRRVVAVTHAAIIRAALVVALEAPPQAFWRIDVAPLSLAELHTAPLGWRVSRIGA